MKIEIVLSIIGFFGTLGLTVNAFFLKGIFMDLNTVKIQLATLSAMSKAKEDRLGKLEDHQEDIFNRINKLEVGR